MARHPVDVFSFVSGVLILALGLLLLSGDLGGVPLEWAGPTVAIGLGVVILLAARGGQPRPDGAEPAPEPPTATGD